MYRISDWKSNPHEQNYKMEEGSEVLCGVGRGGVRLVKTSTNFILISTDEIGAYQVMFA